MFIVDMRLQTTFGTNYFRADRTVELSMIVNMQIQILGFMERDFAIITRKAVSDSVMALDSSLGSKIFGAPITFPQMLLHLVPFKNTGIA
jgi:hypothetical protein